MHENDQQQELVEPPADVTKVWSIGRRNDELRVNSRRSHGFFPLAVRYTIYLLFLISSVSFSCLRLELSVSLLPVHRCSLLLIPECGIVFFFLSLCSLHYLFGVVGLDQCMLIYQLILSSYLTYLISEI